MSDPMIEAPTLEGWTHVLSGKVRELYVPEGSTLAHASEVLVVASDRISAFDYSLKPGIPDKGKILTRMSLLWFEQLRDVIAHHVISADDVPAQVHGRALRCQGLDMIPLECVVRGYLTGSGLSEYRRTGSVSGHALPAGLQDGSALPRALFTPSTKAEPGGHDENITVDQAREQLGDTLVEHVREASLTLYERARTFARERGIILADTKFEFGHSRTTGDLVLADEVLTPDSSRFWDAASFEVGEVHASFDKQFVRDWLTHESGWDRTGGEEPPTLAEHIVHATRARYLEAWERLSGEPF